MGEPPHLEVDPAHTGDTPFARSLTCSQVPGGRAWASLGVLSCLHSNLPVLDHGKHAAPRVWWSLELLPEAGRPPGDGRAPGDVWAAFRRWCQTSPKAVATTCPLALALNHSPIIRCCGHASVNRYNTDLAQFSEVLWACNVCLSLSPHPQELGVSEWAPSAGQAAVGSSWTCGRRRVGGVRVGELV